MSLSTLLRIASTPQLLLPKLEIKASDLCDAITQCRLLRNITVAKFATRCRSGIMINCHDSVNDTDR